MYPQRGGRRGRINMQLLTAPSVFSYTYIHVPSTWGPSWSYQYAIIDCSSCFLLHLYTCTPNVGAVVVVSIYNYGLLLLFSLTLIYMYPQPVMKCINGQYMPSFLQQLPPITFLEKTKIILVIIYAKLSCHAKYSDSD